MKIHVVNSTKTAISAIEESLGIYDLTLTETETYDGAENDIRNTGARIVVINIEQEDDPVEDLVIKLRRSKTFPYICVICLIDRSKQKMLDSLIGKGIDDFVIRPFSKDEFRARIDIADRNIKKEDSANKTGRKLIKLAKEDPLTNLLNRRSILDEALKEMGRSSREMKHLAVVMTEISNFKDFLDEFGAESADQLLIEFARRVKVSCRPYDKAGRYGIADFLIYLPSSDVKVAEKVAQRQLKLFNDEPFLVNSNPVNVTVAIGLSELNPDYVLQKNPLDDHYKNDRLLDDLLSRAESAKEEARNSGPNLVRSFVLV